MAMDWETSFAQMVGLANVPAEEVEHLQEAVLALAGDTAQAPAELADALYLAASAGLTSADALEVVEMAAASRGVGNGFDGDGHRPADVGPRLVRIGEHFGGPSDRHPHRRGS